MRVNNSLIDQKYINNWSRDLYSKKKRKKIEALNNIPFMLNELGSEKLLFSKDFINMLLDFCENEDKNILTIYFKNLSEYINYIKRKNEIQKIIPILEKICCLDTKEIREKAFK